ncbi:MAG: hypothetical protein ICV78_08835 [Tolypothrix sp. Co-bin9]|nr:hypothetical protein [Tolypothrix sp. Co-bin9]
MQAGKLWRSRSITDKVGHWALGNGQWEMGNGHWALEIKKLKNVMPFK